MAAVAGGAGIALGMTPAVAATGAGLAAVIRVLAGDSPAALTGAVLAPLLAVASLASAGAGAGAAAAGTGAASAASLRAVLALAAAGWAVTELARPIDAAASTSRRVVAALPAAIAGILDPSFAALLAIAGLRAVTTPWRPRAPRWAIAVPAAGALLATLAALAGTVWPGLGAAWFGTAAHPVAPIALATTAADVLGPLTAVAALAGLGGLVAAVASGRMRHGEIALAAAIAGALLVDLRAGAVGAATVGLAALLAGLAIGRLAAMIRIAAGQAIVAATLGALLIAPPAWIALDRPAAAHTERVAR